MVLLVGGLTIDSVMKTSAFRPMPDNRTLKEDWSSCVKEDERMRRPGESTSQTAKVAHSRWKWLNLSIHAYSASLGVLAGDTLHSAEGYFRQRLVRRKIRRKLRTHRVRRMRLFPEKATATVAIGAVRAGVRMAIYGVADFRTCTFRLQVWTARRDDNPEGEESWHGLQETGSGC